MTFVKALTPEQRFFFIAPIVLCKAVALELQEQACEMLKELAPTSASRFEGVPKNMLPAIKSTKEK